MIMGGALLNVLLTRWGYRRFDIANWEEEWRWKREVKRSKMHREEELIRQQEDQILDDLLESNDDADADRTISSEMEESVMETETIEKTSGAEDM